MKTTNKRITYRLSVDPYSNGILGDLTEKQWAELVTRSENNPMQKLLNHLITILCSCLMAALMVYILNGWILEGR